jgi:DNA polymerase IV
MVLRVVRKIIHVDMDAFYASVEQRDQPEYQGKPIVVGGSPDVRGAVAAASYEARKFGIHSAMPSRIAIQKCPHVIFVKPRFDVYRAVSQEIRAIFDRYTDLVEPLSLDEAYLDVTENKQNSPSATRIAQDIKDCIARETGLTASAGISFNKFLAKIASGMNKPNGLFLIRPEAAEEFLQHLPIEKFHGIGQVTAAKMHQLGIRVGADLSQWSEADLVELFGKVGGFYYRIVRAQDDRPVEPNRLCKSIGVETSFAIDLSDRSSMLSQLETIADTLKERLDQKQTYGRTLTLKLKYADYQQVTRSKTSTHSIRTRENILAIAQELLTKTEPLRKKVRLLGLSVSNLESGSADLTYVQLTLDY